MTAGRSLQGLGNPQSYLFKNFAKNSVSITGVATDSPPWPSLLDINGYPVASSMNNIAFSINVPPSYTGRWAISFDGVGEILILLSSTTIFDQDSCVVAAGGNTLIRSNTASEARGKTRVVVQFAAAPKTFSTGFPGGSTKYSSVGGLSSMQNLVFCRCSSPYGNGGATASGDEVDILSGDTSRMFNDDSLAVVSALNPAVLRFMGVQDINASNVSHHSTRPPMTALTFMSQRYDPTLWAGRSDPTPCVTAGSNGIYTIGGASSTPGTLTDGEQIQVKFNSAQQAAKSITSATLTGGTSIAITVADASDLAVGQKCYVSCPGFVDTSTSASGLNNVYTISVSGNTITISGGFTGAYTSGGQVALVPTINVASRGAVPLVDKNGTVLTTTAGAITTIAANAIATLTYDALLQSFIYSSGGLGGTFGSYPPFEALVALCKKLNVGYWHCFPVMMLTSEALTQAAVIRDLMNGTALPVYFEYGNEIWNFGFTQWHLLTSRGVSYGISTSSNAAYMSYSSQRICEIMGGIGALWSGTAPLNRVLSFQGAGDVTTETYLWTSSLLKSGTPGYWSKNPVDYSTIGNRAVDLTDVFSYGVYFYGPMAGQTDAGDYLAAGVTPTRNAAFFASLTTAADAFAAGDTSQVAFIDNDVRVGTTPPVTVTIASDGTFTLGAGTCTSNGIFNASLLQLFVSGGSLPGSLTPINKIYYAVSVSTSAFKISLTRGGAAITGLTGGSGTFSVGLTGQTMLRWNTDRLAFWNAYAETYGKPVVLYEAATSAWFPAISTCSTLGLTSPTASVASQRILDLVTAWQKSNLSQQTSYDQMKGFMQASKSRLPAQLQLEGLNSWSMLQGYVPPVTGNTTSFQGDILCAKNGSYDSVRLFNIRKRRIVVKT